MDDPPRNYLFDELIQKYRYHFLIVLIGLILVGTGLLFFRKSLDFSSSKIEVLKSAEEGISSTQITAEISGAVIIPGVYKLPSGSRIDDLLIAAGGFSADADRVWSDKFLNRAALISDGQKVYIPKINEQSSNSSAKTSDGYQTISTTNSSDSNQLININTATLGQLDSLPGIGPVYAQKIVEHRPYSKVEDVVSSGAVTQTIYEKIKNSISVF